MNELQAAMTPDTLPKRIVIFDGVCNLCEFSVNFIYERDRDGKFTFTPAQSSLGSKLLQDYKLNDETLDTVVLVKNGRAYTRSSAALEIASELDIPWSFLQLFSVIPQFLRDQVYDVIARNRYRWFGKKESCMIPTPEIKARFLEQPPPFDGITKL